MMEKKKKGTFGKVVGVLLSLILLAVLADGFVKQYPRMAQDAKKIYDDAILNVDYGIARNHVEQVAELLYGFHVQYAKEALGDERSAGEILMSGVEEEDLKYILSSSQDYHFYSSSNGMVVALPTPSGQIIPTVTPKPTRLPEEQEEEWKAYAEGYQVWHDDMVAYWDAMYETDFKERLEELNLRYCIRDRANSEKWYGTDSWEKLVGNEFVLEVRIEFESGRPYVIYESMPLESEEVFEERYDTFREQMTYDGILHGGAELLEDTIFIIVADESLFPENTENTYNSYWYQSNARWDCLGALRINYVYFVLAAFVILFLAALVLSLIKPLRLRELRISNIPLEVLVVTVGVLVAVMAEVMPELILATQMSVDYPGCWFEWYGILADVMAGKMEGQVLLLVNELIWFAIFFAAFFCIISMLQVFYKGFLGFLKKNTIIGRILCFAGAGIKQRVEWATTIDLKEKGTKKLFLLVSANFVIIYGVYSLMLLFVDWLSGYGWGTEALFAAWIAGFFIFLWYSVLLFGYLQKKWEMIRLQYSELLDTTEEMASGDTQVRYEGKPGIFHELQDKLQRVQAGFDTAVQEEVKSQRMKSELITNVSHDLKTPLTAIITYVDLLKNEDVSEEERREYVQVLEQKSARLKTLIEDLFEVSKANSGNIKLNPQELDLVNLMQEVQLNLEDRIMQSGIQFKLSAPQEKVMVCLDGQKTCRVFENLFVNITKYGLYGSRAFVEVENLKDRVRVTVKNVSATEITYASDEIMERFTRGDASRNTEGSGLGLAIVKSFVEAQGGTVEIQLDGDLFKVIVEFPKGKMTREPEATSQTEDVVTDGMSEAIADDTAIDGGKIEE